MKRILIITIVGCTSLSSCKDTPANSTNQEKAFNLLKSIETKDEKALLNINPNKFIQHDLSVSDGYAGFKTFLKQLPKSGVVVSTVRVFEDGDYVFTHSEGTISSSQNVFFDVFRFENGEIVEHWNNVQPKATNPNASGHTMVDGSTKINDYDLTETNKKIASDFVNEILINANYDAIAKFFNGNSYIQHNPHVGDGLDSFASNQKKALAAGTLIKHTKLHKVLGDGNFVLTISEAKHPNTHKSYYNLFRFEEGKIAEHWDAIEDILPLNERKNKNGKFNFPEDGKVGSYPFVGKKFKADFGVFSFSLDFLTPSKLRWSTTEGKSETETMAVKQLRPNLYMIYWTEKDGTNVVHVEDYENHTIYTNIVSKDGKITNLKGTLIEEKYLEKPQTENITPKKQSYPFVGHKYKADFGTFGFVLDFVSPTQLTWSTPDGKTETETITVKEIRPDLYMIYWTEKDGTHVVHLEDYATEILFTNIIAKNGVMVNKKGTLLEIK